jgi:hypothetical protein
MKLKEKQNFKEKEVEFNKFIVSEYLRYGSVDEVFKANDYSLPISYPGVQRLLDKWGIVKAAGPNTLLSESISFMVRMVEEQIPLETLYRKMPPSFTPSLTTLHRIYRGAKKEVKKKIEERKMRRVGAALIITQEGKENEVLIGHDTSTPRLDLGKPFGSISLPMGFSKRAEPRGNSVLRVLQQEVLTQHAIERNLPFEKIYQEQKPFMFIDIADVRVSVYHIEIPRNLNLNFSSYKLKNLKTVKTEDVLLLGNNLRQGMHEIMWGYRNYYLQANEAESPIYTVSSLNRELALLRAEY